MLKIKKTKLLTFSFILLLTCTLHKQIKAQCHIDDWTALKALYESTDGDNWKDRTGWDVMIDNQNTPPTNCDLKEIPDVSIDESGRVDYLAIPNNQLSGSIPFEIGNLTGLVKLTLNSNELNGSIPVEISNLSNLTHLALYGNELSGNIPAQLSNLSELKELNLDNNDLTGGIPIELGNLRKLTSLNLSGNAFSGNIPEQLSKLSNLTYLNLRNNELTGSIPAQLGNLSELTYLNLGSNYLSGSIPAQLGALSNLEYLNLGYNALKNNIPPELSNLSSLIELNLADNDLSGNIPPELGNLNLLSDLSLSYNQLTGGIPSELGNLTLLTYLGLASNNLSGEIPPELGRLTDLTDLTLNQNQLVGNIPAELGKLINLEKLYLYENKLTGKIPKELGMLSNLIHLELYNNQLNGNIPIELGNLSDLEVLDLEKNNLSGSIPAELSNLISLTELWINNNQLSGSIPPQLGDLDNLEELYLSNNQLSDEIPSELGSLINLTNLRLSNNKLSGSIPAELGNLNNLTELYLNKNKLNGSIPAELGNLSMLTKLSLNSNQLKGSIPIELGELKGITEFLIAYNYFYCNDIQSVYHLKEQIASFSYLPQYFKPINCHIIKSNLFDTVSQNQHFNLDIDFPFDTTGYTYQWYRNGNILFGATQAILNFDTIQPNNVGKYTLQATNANCLPDGSTFEAISEPMYVILKGYDLYGQPVEYDQIMVEFENAQDTELYEKDILAGNGWPLKKCNCNRELYLWQFESTEKAAKALIEIDRKTVGIDKKSTLKGGFNNLVKQIKKLKSKDKPNGSLAYKVISETLNMDYPDSVMVYILDSGLDDQGLDAGDTSFTVNPAPIDTCYDVKNQIGYSYVDSTDSTIPVSNNYQDELWHGTYGFHSITENLNEDHKLKVIPLKIFDKNGTGNLFDMTCALHHAINNDADVINISAGYQGQPSAILETAINEARKKGIFITAAAGNDTIKIDTLAQYPAFYAGQYYTYETIDASGNAQLDSTRYDNVISIASINENDSISQFSNVGKQSVTIAAYGEDIHGYGLGGDDIVAVGTSMSTFFVAKELALEIASNKNRTYQQIWNDFEQDRLVANNSLEEFTQTGKHLKVKLAVASIPGCTNRNACNYYEYATIDDGTCQFAAYHPSDWAALKALYLSTNGDNWKRNNYWEIFIQDTIPPPCNLNNLYGVSINEEGRVYRINLYNNNLNGEIPAEIEGLTELSELYLAANNLVGEIPVELTKLDKITDLVLSANYLSGNIPLEVGELNKLKRLNLSYNQLGGEIPPQLGQLNQLKYLKLNNNKLIGNIPGELGQLKNLYLLNISNNLLSGCYENNLEQLCNQKWSPLFKGNANISDGNSFDSTWENFCTNKEGTCESINRLNDKPKMFSLYPNPSEGKIFIKFSTNEYKNNSLKISNLEGKCILKIEGKHLSDNTFEMDLGDLPKGMYILELQNEYKNYAEKFILK